MNHPYIPSPGFTSPDVLAALKERLRTKSYLALLPNDPAVFYALLRLAAHEGGAFYGIAECSDGVRLCALIELSERARAVVAREFELQEPPGKSIFVLSSGAWWIESTGGPVSRAGDISLPLSEGFDFHEF